MSLFHRALDRLVPRLTAPLSVLWAWPGGGAETWLESLLHGGARRLELSSLEDGLAGLDAGDLAVLDGDGEDVASALEAHLADLPPGARLVVADSPRPRVGAVPHLLVKPPDLALDRFEVESLAKHLGCQLSSSELDALHGRYAGWFEPTAAILRARRRTKLEGAGEKSEGLGEPLPLDQLAPPEVQVLAEVQTASSRLSRPIPAEAWRFFFAEDAEKLAAFERLGNRWALIGDLAPPSFVMSRGAVRLGIKPGDAADINPGIPSDGAFWRSLASALAATEHGELAAGALGLAGDGAVAFLFKARSLPKAESLPKTRSRADPTLSAKAAPRRHSATYQLRLLGPPTVARENSAGDDEEIHWRLHRSLLAVARLALAPDRRLPRDELVEALWPYASADHVARNFHPTLSAARRALTGGAKIGGDKARGGKAGERGGGIVQRHGIYALDPTAEWRIDVEAFSRHLASADEESDPELALLELEAAWRLYRGPLLDGFEAEWIEEPRRRQHGHYLDMLRRLGDVASTLGRETLALDAYRRLLLDEPFEERIHVELMEIYGRRGRRDLVRRQFVHLQELLKDLHAEPAEETVERYHRLMS